jgi:hypothetical protein
VSAKEFLSSSGLFQTLSQRFTEPQAKLSVSLAQPRTTKQVQEAKSLFLVSLIKPSFYSICEEYSLPCLLLCFWLVIVDPNTHSPFIWNRQNHSLISGRILTGSRSLFARKSLFFLETKL